MTLVRVTEDSQIRLDALIDKKNLLARNKQNYE